MHPRRGMNEQKAFDPIYPIFLKCIIEYEFTLYVKILSVIQSNLFVNHFGIK